jgi:hypothetical protein
MRGAAQKRNEILENDAMRLERVSWGKCGEVVTETKHAT